MPSDNQDRQPPTPVPLPSTSCSRCSHRSCASGPDPEQTLARGDRVLDTQSRSQRHPPSQTIAAYEGLLMFAVCSPSIKVCENDGHSRFVFSLTRTWRPVQRSSSSALTRGAPPEMAIRANIARPVQPPTERQCSRMAISPEEEISTIWLSFSWSGGESKSPMRVENTSGVGFPFHIAE